MIFIYSLVGKVLSNRELADVSDLTKLVLDVFDDISEEIRGVNDDGFCVFWNVENREPLVKGRKIFAVSFI